jgi:hypothetical protein
MKPGTTFRERGVETETAGQAGYPHPTESRFHRPRNVDAQRLFADPFVVHRVIHRQSGVVTFDREASVVPHKTAKRPGVGAPWAASDPHPHGIEEGTLSESNGRYLAAVEHLAMLKSRRERALRDEVYYVQLGAKYGVSEADIVRTSGLPADRVRQIVADGA